ncbi:carboxymuconolactone decarboxylase family protein [Microbispora sp. NPDC088329]|uniref:carboxymuconolactone decarboxylase family protein n=1 Tax=Microbispora sp. NPDC088329 TaxID=3154869 RepID=UPI00342F20BD
MTARISLTPPSTELLERIERHFQRRLGAALEPMRAMAHQPQVLATIVELEKNAAGWNAVDQELKELAVMAAAFGIGCSWCIDYGYWASVSHGIPAEKVEAISAWRDSDLFTELERRVLAYAEAMTETPPAVTDEMVCGLLRDLTEPQVVELTAIVAVENQRARLNAALGLTSQGFKERCEIPVPGKD